ncbi:hypothetical protein ACFLU6_16000, partial [Acidobacteriota bacterium]
LEKGAVRFGETGSRVIDMGGFGSDAVELDDLEVSILKNQTGQNSHRILRRKAPNNMRRP